MVDRDCLRGGWGGGMAGYHNCLERDDNDWGGRVIEAVLDGDGDEIFLLSKLDAEPLLRNKYVD
jgi:hypothetical protein